MSALCIRTRALGLAAFIALLGMISPAMAQTTTMVTDPGTMTLRNNGQGNWAGNTGFEFTVGDQAATVTSLGIYDAPGNKATPNQGKAGDGLETPAIVTIYQVNGKKQVAQVTVPAGEDGTLDGDYRYAKLDTPVKLDAGQTYRIVIGVDKGGNGFLDYHGDAAAKAPTFSGDFSGFGPYFATKGDATHAAYPTGSRAGGRWNGVAYSGPNMQYTTQGGAASTTSTTAKSETTTKSDMSAKTETTASQAAAGESKTEQSSAKEQAIITAPGSMELRNNGKGNWAGNTGFELTVGKQDVKVSSLGIYDAPGSKATPNQGEAGDGLETDAIVTIYETKGRTQVAQATVPAGKEGTLKDDYRYAKLKTPVTLHAGTTYRIAIGVDRGGNGFLNYSGDANAKAPTHSDDFTGFLPVFATRGDASHAAYPADNRGGSYHGVAYSGPNFLYEGTGEATAPPKIDPQAMLRTGKPGPDNKPEASDFPGNIVTSVNFEKRGPVIPAGWQVGPGTPKSSTLTIADFGAGGSGHSLKVTNDWPMYDQSTDGSLFYAFDKPVDRAEIEFDLKWTTKSHAAFIFFTQGPKTSGPSQVNISNGKSTINQDSGIINGHHWIIPDGERNNKGAVATHWYRVRIVAAKDSNSINIWVSQPDQTTLPEKPTKTFPAYESNQPIASVHFGVVGIWSNNYYLDNITIRTGDDIPAPADLPDTQKETLAKGYQLWTGKTFPKTFDDISYPKGIEYHIINNGRHWQHGASIAAYKGALYASWGSNERGENSAGEIVLGAKSTDDGETWSEPFVIAPGDGQGGKEYSNSHGVMLVHDGKLWGFYQHWKGGWNNPLAIEAFILNDKTGKWESQGIVARKGWPIDPPQHMANGNWIIGLSGFEMWLPAVTISHGDDLLHWDTVAIPTDGKRRFPETSVITYDDSHVISFTRWGQNAWCATSADGGKTWTKMRESNYPSTANPSSGVLSTGQWFLISNMRNRDHLLIGVGKPGEHGLSKVYKIRSGSPPDAIHPYEGKTFPRNYSYPSYVEHDGKLYVVYSVSKRDIELAVIPIKSLSAE